ncbi:hypothetical protein C7S16_7061 [Burkholderia thailandensis]|uniref:Uncharacterized protein n=1 Tax=Burkholderia thailandensis TaxID=57975 RepID=A0AAW9CKR1_BURTH|nr:hypothetical protein [Burkholderia thailandensis]MDW9251620.1 hypothetical protein [Burkholderia thailandensis]
MRAGRIGFEPRRSADGRAIVRVATTYARLPADASARRRVGATLRFP